jgi:signal transduction histidine kinase
MDHRVRDEPRTPPRRDVLVALIYLLVVIALCTLDISSAGLVASSQPWPGGVSAALLVPAALATVLRRRAPVVTLVVTGVLSFAEVLWGGTIGGYVLLFEALWSPIAHGSERLARAASGVGVAVSLVMLGVVASWPEPGPAIVVGLLLVAVVVGTPLAWGWEVRHLHLARETAERLAAAQRELADERAERAVETERTRLAQDLHDVLSGHLSAVALHAGLAADLPSAAGRERSLATTRESAQAALRDLRSVITMLTDEGGDPQVTLSWEALAARLAADDEADLHVDPRIEDPDQVDTTLRAALLRIASEAVANALAHGLPPRRLDVRATADEAILICTNTCAPDRARADGTPGMGLRTMRSRALAVGGVMRTGQDPADPRMWSVEVRVPLSAAASDEPAGDPTIPVEAAPAEGTEETIAEEAP